MRDEPETVESTNRILLSRSRKNSGLIMSNFACLQSCSFDGDPRSDLMLEEILETLESPFRDPETFWSIPTAR